MLPYSVALCTYNGSQYIIEQLNSIITQSIRPSQIVLSDDGSTDGTVDIARTLLDESGIDYLLIQNTESLGVTLNFQNAISMCTFPIIFTSDQDDVWGRDKAKVMLDFFKKNEKALLVFSNGEIVSEDLALTGTSLWEYVGLSGTFLNEKDWFRCLLKNCVVTGAAMAFRIELFNMAKPFPKEWLHDGWLSWVALSHKGLCPCPHKLLYYRQHSSNTVGMTPSICKRALKWFANFKEMDVLRENRSKRFQIVSDRLASGMPAAQIEELQKCISFWDDLISLKRKDQIGRLILLSKLYFHGCYNKYYVGFRGFIRDIMLLLF